MAKVIKKRVKDAVELNNLLLNGYAIKKRDKKFIEVEKVVSKSKTK